MKPHFSLQKISFSPIITTSDKIIQIFKSLRVARVLLCLAEKILCEYSILQSARAVLDLSPTRI